ncbi:MAG: hypothetical protein HZY76_07745 [Anaerolineae bacterium]|nr:MAG: hypothetical protein HZY76_07745 [Anaerolineae bacterium]
MRALTVALTQALARRFRDRPEDALLVLTRDYETLDFVLVERGSRPKRVWPRRGRGRLSQRASAAVRARGKALTLGSMGIILASSREAALRAFVVQLYPRGARLLRSLAFRTVADRSSSAGQTAAPWLGSAI